MRSRGHASRVRTMSSDSPNLFSRYRSVVLASLGVWLIASSRTAQIPTIGSARTLFAPAHRPIALERTARREPKSLRPARTTITSTAITCGRTLQRSIRDSRVSVRTLQSQKQVVAHPQSSRAGSSQTDDCRNDPGEPLFTIGQTVVPRIFKIMPYFDGKQAARVLREQLAHHNGTSQQLK
jgi:hypothetical protein